jgi:hypothetical protein
VAVFADEPFVSVVVGFVLVVVVPEEVVVPVPLPLPGVV